VTIFTVAVTFATHDEVKDGNPHAGLQFAAVLADDPITATLIAAQMVACHGVMPTSTTIIDAVI
jgi:hypothetical protein